MKSKFAEDLGVLEALKLTVNSMYPFVHVFSDAQAIISWVCNPSTVPPRSIRHIIKEYTWVIDQFKKVSLSFARRSTNNVARKDSCRFGQIIWIMVSCRVSLNHLYLHFVLHLRVFVLNYIISERLRPFLPTKTRTYTMN